MRLVALRRAGVRDVDICGGGARLLGTVIRSDAGGAPVLRVLTEASF